MERQTIIAAQRRSVEHMINHRLLWPLTHSNSGGVDACAGPNCLRRALQPPNCMHCMPHTHTTCNARVACSTPPAYKTCFTYITYDCGSETLRNGEKKQHNGYVLAFLLSDERPSNIHLHIHSLSPTRSIILRPSSRSSASF